MNQTPMPSIRTGVDLKHLNTFGVPSSASLFCEIKSTKQMYLLRESNFFDEFMPFVLGGGSNVLLSEQLKIPVLKTGMKGINIISSEKSSVRVEVKAGEEWHHLVQWAVERDFGGIENLALIPGTVGAAPIQNIGAYGTELKDRMELVEWLDFRDFKVHRFTPQECAFGYRDSIFKNELKGVGMVTAVILRLTSEKHQLRFEYGALREYLREKSVESPTIVSIFEAVVAIRQSKLPDPAVNGNAGSFFKNPVIPISQFEELQQTEKELPGYPDKPGYMKVPAGWLIEKAGWKGRRSGNTGTWSKQALVIVNYGGADAGEILALADSIRLDVLKKFGVALSPEVNLIC